MWLLAVTALGSLALACGRAHLQGSTGKAYQAALTAQAPPKATPKPAAPGLDPQDAEIIADGYRRSLAPKDVKVTEEPFVIVQPAGGYVRPTPLAPSVPKEPK